MEVKVIDCTGVPRKIRQAMNRRVFALINRGGYEPPALHKAVYTALLHEVESGALAVPEQIASWLPMPGSKADLALLAEKRRGR